MAFLRRSHVQPSRRRTSGRGGGGALRSLCGLLGAVLASTVHGAEPPPRSTLNLASSDGAYTVKLGGRINWDTDTFDGALNRERAGARRFDTQLRRARVEMSGTLRHDFYFVFDVDVLDRGTGSNAQIHAAGLGYTGWRFADLFIGRNKEPFGLEELMSSKALSSIEYNYFSEATDADSQSQYGVRLDGRVGPVGWAFGVFNPNGNPQRADGGDRLAFTGRLFGASLQGPDRVVHLGAAVTDRNLDEPTLAHGFKLDIAEAGGNLDSRAILIRDDRQAGLEGLYINGPFSIQSEVFRRRMPGADAGPDGEIRHHYLQATWTLTGESRGYRKAQGVPGLIRPSGRRGALELVVKEERITFDVTQQKDQTVNGLLLGANWYPNPYVKLMLNVIRVESNGVVAPNEPGNATVVSTRVQVAF
jgi:phosphate-selective porin OprO and OprP